MIVQALYLSLLSLSPQNGPTAETPEPETKAVASRVGSLRVTLERQGRLVPVEATRILVELDAYQGELKITDCVEHGALVNQGDVLAQLDTEKLDEQIRRAEFELAQAEARARNTEEEQQVAEAGARDDLTRAEREAEWARRKLRGYLEHELEFDREQDRLSKQSTQHGLEDQEDELGQLEKMYKEDELVDSTEEIVLKRSRRRLASSRAYANLQERRTTYQFDVPKGIERERLELDTELKARAASRAERSGELGRAGRQLALERSRFDLQEKKDALASLRRDREHFTVRASGSGILLHGKEDAAPGTSRLEKGGRASAGTVLMSIVDPDRFEVRTDVPESHLLRARTGTAAEIVIAAAPDDKQSGALRVDLLPSAREGETNLYRATIPLGVEDPKFRPGMACKVTAILDSVQDAVLVPVAAVQSKDGRKTVRCAASASGPFEEREVTVGPDDGTDVVIRSGVTAGEFVALAAEEKKK